MFGTDKFAQEEDRGRAEAKLVQSKLGSSSVSLLWNQSIPPFL